MAITFKKKEYDLIYDLHIDKCMNCILSIKDMREKLKQLPIFYNALTMWKKNPLFDAALVLKKIAFVVEKELSNYNDDNNDIILKNDCVIQYLKARAMQQAYYMQNKIKKVTLYRGLNEKEIKTKDMVSNTVFTTPLIGYTHSLFIGILYGDLFGKTIKVEMPVGDIIVDLDKIWHGAWPTGEEEVIVLGIERKVIIFNGCCNVS